MTNLESLRRIAAGTHHPADLAQLDKASGEPPAAVVAAFHQQDLRSAAGLAALLA